VKYHNDVQTTTLLVMVVTAFWWYSNYSVSLYCAGFLQSVWSVIVKVLTMYKKESKV